MDRRSNDVSGFRHRREDGLQLQVCTSIHTSSVEMRSQASSNVRGDTTPTCLF
jgi:hypothetical protein